MHTQAEAHRQTDRHIHMHTQSKTMYLCILDDMHTQTETPAQTDTYTCAHNIRLCILCTFDNMHTQTETHTDTHRHTRMHAGVSRSSSSRRSGQFHEAPQEQRSLPRSSSQGRAKVAAMPGSHQFSASAVELEFLRSERRLRSGRHFA